MPNFYSAVQRLAAISQAAMPDTVEVIRSVETETEAGYPRPEDAVIAVVKGRVRDTTAREEIVANQAGYRADAEVSMPFGTDVLPDDRLRVNGVVYQITSLNSETSDALKVDETALVRRTG